MTRSSKELPPAPDVTGSHWDPVDRRALLEYSTESETYRASFDCDTGSVSTAVISTVAAVAEQHPQELPPLYSFIDPDALDAVVESTTTSPSNGDVHVSFTFDGYPVTVHNAGIITIDPPE